MTVHWLMNGQSGLLGLFSKQLFNVEVFFYLQQNKT